MVTKYPAYYRPNVWPRKQLPELEGIFKGLGGLIYQVCLHRECLPRVPM